MASVLDTSEEKTNGTRLARLVIDGGTHALREFLNSIHPPSVLPIVLTNNEPKFRSLKSRGKIFNDHWEQLFPSSGAPPDSNNFDITLLHLLLREICVLPAPGTGWHEMPADTDSSREAHIVRIKCFRNDLCHSISTAICNDEFQTKWALLSTSLIALGLDTKEIDRLKTEPIDHDTKRRLEEEIKRWDSLEPRVHTLEQKFDQLDEKFENMSVQESRSSGLCSCLPDAVPEVFGRSKEIEQATKSIHNEEAAAVMITGAPGFGKTTVANKVAHELNTLRHFVLYCSLRSKATLKDVATSMILACSTNHSQPPENPQHWLLNWSKQQLDNITFVLDNADDALETQDSRTHFLSMIYEMRTLSQQKITFVITSRKTMNTAGYDLNIIEIRLCSLSQDESVKLLLSKIYDAKKRNELSQTKRIVDLCACVPLALCIIGSLLSDFKEDTLINSLEKEPLDILKDNEISIENTIKTSFDLLKSDEQKALAIFAVFPGPFDLHAAHAVATASPPNQTEAQTIEILRALKSRSLLEQPASGKFQVHQLIQAFTKKRARTIYDPHVYSDVEKVACAHFISRLVDAAQLYWSKDKCKESIEAFNSDRYNFEYFLQVYVETMAEQPYHPLLESCTTKFLDQFPQKCMYMEMCLLPSFYIAVLEEFLKNFEMGEQRFHTVELLCLLSNELRKIGKQERYQNLMKKAKEIYSRNYTEFRTNGLSRVFFFNSYARYLFERFQDLPEKRCVNDAYYIALGLCNRKLKPDHPEKAATLLFIGKREKNIQVLQDATDIFTSSLGQHFMTAQGHKAIADFYLKKTNESEIHTSMAHYQRALEIMDNCGMLGHKETILALKNYAFCQRRIGSYQEAKTYLKKAKQVAEVELEEDHKWKVMIDTQVAFLYNDLEQTEEAIAIMKNALEMSSRLKVSIDQLGGSRHDIRHFLDCHPEACPENLL